MRPVLLSCALACSPYYAGAAETMIPLDPESGVQLGQGFDADRMEWREVCVQGERSEKPSKEASVGVFESSVNSSAYDQLQGSMSAGVNLVGGLFGAKAKASIFGEWSESDRSSASGYQVSFGSSYVWLKNVRASLAEVEGRNFKRKCGTHVAIGLGTDHEVTFFLKYLAADKEWIEKTRLDFELKVAGGLVKKKWSREKIQGGIEAGAQMKVGISRSGYFRELFRPLVDRDELFSISCAFDSLEPCFRLSDTFYATLEALKRDIAEGRLTEVPLLADQAPTKVILVPYAEASTDFRTWSRKDLLLSKTAYLNPLKIRLAELKSAALDEMTLDPDTFIASSEAINEVELTILKCERHNLCS